MANPLTDTLISRLKWVDKDFEIADSGGRNSVSGLRVRVTRSAITYYLRYSFKGKRRWTKLGRTNELTLGQARTLARSILAQAVEAEHGRAPDPGDRNEPKTVPTIGQWIAEHYSPSVLAHKKSGKATLKRLSKWFTFLMECRLDDPELLQSVMLWRDERLRDGKSAVTINRDVSTLSACLAEAVEREVLELHPLRRLKPLKHADNKRVRYLAVEEERRLWEALNRREERIRSERDSANAWRKERGRAEMYDLRKAPFADYLKPMVTLALHTGLRRGELFDLQWTDVDMDTKVITVNAATSKTGKTRRVPMNQLVQDTLNGWGDMMGRNGHVFASPKTGGRMDNISTSWEALLEDADIQNFRFHDCRHHFASRLVQNGVPLNDVRELLGHTTMTMTLRYAHLAPEHGHSAVARLALDHQRFTGESNIHPISRPAK